MAHFTAKFNDEAVIERLASATRTTTDTTYKTAWRCSVKLCGVRGAMLKDTDIVLRFIAHLDIVSLMASTLHSHVITALAIAMTLE